MTADKPKSWQSWIAYAIIGLLVMVGPYVGAYLLLGEHTVYIALGYPSTTTSAGLPAPTDAPPGHVREFEYDSLRLLLAPLGGLEAKIRGQAVEIESPIGLDRYEPGW